jgi:(E)-4-hydroxy-3-methylbut-2-enyl-diphosphate synthase
VNGPGEAAHADLAVTGIGNKIYLYEKGTLVREVLAQDAEEVLFTHLEALVHAQ